MSYQQQRGVGLIEVMISLLVIGVGALGFLALQTQALRQQQESYYFARTNLLANDLFEMMRLNPSAALESDYILTKIATKADFEKLTKVKPEACAAVCTAKDLAEYQVYFWSERVFESIPSATNSVSVTDGVIALTVEIGDVMVGGEAAEFIFETRL